LYQDALRGDQELQVLAAFTGPPTSSSHFPQSFEFAEKNAQSLQDRRASVAVSLNPNDRRMLRWLVGSLWESKHCAAAIAVDEIPVANEQKTTEPKSSRREIVMSWFPFDARMSGAVANCAFRPVPRVRLLGLRLTIRFKHEFESDRY